MAKKKPTLCVKNVPASVPASQFDGGLLGLIGTCLLTFLAFLGGLIIPVLAAGALLYFTGSIDLENLSVDALLEGNILFLAAAGVLVLLGVFFAIAWSSVVFTRWKVRHTKINGKRLKFKGCAWGLFGNMLKWLFFTVITVCIYALWLPIKAKKWTTSKTVMEDPTPVVCQQQPAFNAAYAPAPVAPMANPYMQQPMPAAAPIMAPAPMSFPAMPFPYAPMANYGYPMQNFNQPTQNN